MEKYNPIESVLHDYVDTLREKAEYDAHGINTDDYALRLNIIKSKAEDLCIPKDVFDKLHRPAYYSSMEDGGASYSDYDKKIDIIITDASDDFAVHSPLYTMAEGRPLTKNEIDFATLYKDSNDDFAWNAINRIVDFSQDSPICLTTKYRDILDDVSMDIDPMTPISSKSVQLSNELLYHEAKTILDKKIGFVMDYDNCFRNYAKKMLNQVRKAMKENNQNWTADNNYFIGRYIGDSTKFNVDKAIARELLLNKVSPKRVAEELSKKSPRIFTHAVPDARLEVASNIVMEEQRCIANKQKSTSR